MHYVFFFLYSVPNVDDTIDETKFIIYQGNTLNMNEIIKTIVLSHLHMSHKTVCLIAKLFNDPKSKFEKKMLNHELWHRVMF